MTPPRGIRGLIDGIFPSFSKQRNPQSLGALHTTADLIRQQMRLLEGLKEGNCIVFADYLKDEAVRKIEESNTCKPEDRLLHLGAAQGFMRCSRIMARVDDYLDAAIEQYEEVLHKIKVEEEEQEHVR